MWDRATFLDVRLVPLVAVFLSAAVLVPTSTLYGKRSVATSVARRKDGLVWKVFRAIATLALLSLSVFSGAAHEAPGLVKVSLILSTVYTTILTLLSVTASSNGGLTSPATHSTFILNALFVPYGLRDVWPLLTYTSSPQDAVEGAVLWSKVALIFVAGVCVPLLQPFEYEPVDPNLTQSELNPEQTASIASRLLYTFLTPTVTNANKLSKLTSADLPPLADTDQLRSLIKVGYPELDLFSGAKKSSLFWSLCRVFRASLVLQAVIILFHGPFLLLIPVGTNRLLNYLETDGVGAVVRPWVWVLVTAIGGNFLPSVTNTAYFYMASTALLRIQALLTALIFDHALRVRVVAAPPESPSDSSNQAQHAGLSGLIADLATTDLNNVLGGNQFLLVVLDVPLETALGLGFLYYLLGWAAFAGLGVMLVLLPVPAWLATRMAAAQGRKMRATDARVSAINEAVQVLRMLKLSAYEKAVRKDIADKREEELREEWRLKLVDAINNIVSFAIPLAHLLVSFAVFTLVMKRELTASIVFSSMTAFNTIQGKILTTARMAPGLVRAWVSLGRIERFLNETELLDSFASPSSSPLVGTVDTTNIGISHTVFSFSSAAPESAFKLTIDHELLFSPGCTTLIAGPTGCGKTALLLALLGEMHATPTGSGESWASLDRKNGVAYAAQEGWLMSATVRENVIYGSAFDEPRYRAVMSACALEQDMKILPAGDHTEVGEQGIALSGGQRARVTLARAVYSQAQTVLLDDVLAALDVHTGKWIVEHCLQGELMRGRTVLLVTHHIALASPAAQAIVALTADGRVANVGSIEEALQTNEALKQEFDQDEKTVIRDDVTRQKEEATGREEDDTIELGRLVQEEEVASGSVSWPSWRMLLEGLGGSWPITFFLLSASGPTLREIGAAAQVWWLGAWAQQYLKMPAMDVDVAYYLGVYTAISAAVLGCVVYGRMIWAYGTIRASRKIHDEFVESVMGATFRFLDTTPSSRILARATGDIEGVDFGVTQRMNWVFDIAISMVVYLGAICIISPRVLVPGIVVAAAGAAVGQVYVRAMLGMKRQMSVEKAPVLATFSSAIAGLVSIRAFGLEDHVRSENICCTDRYSRAARTFNTVDKWASVRMDAIGTVFILGLTTYLVYGPQGANPSEIGFSLDMAFGFARLILWLVINVNETQINANALERLHGYISSPQEPRATAKGMPAAYWPATGDLRVENLTARYSVNGPAVLKNLSFHVKSGERVGIVGRTGSGKSTLTMALLRALVTEGDVFYDGVLTAGLNLDALRANTTIIPQSPELLSGTLRRNLDLFGEHDDAVLNDVLRMVGLSESVARSSEYALTLDSPISAGGANLSVGQRQLAALARAMVRRSKLLILDEATSAIDHETDELIQTSLRTQVGKDVTVLIVAHRLRTIIDVDKILVLNAGELVETGSPQELLAIKGSFFHALVDESADRDELYELARAAAS